MDETVLKNAPNNVRDETNTVGKNISGDKNKIFKPAIIPAEERKRLTRNNQIIRTIIRLVMFFCAPAAFQAAFSGVKYIFQQIGTGNLIEWNAFLTSLVVLCAFTVVFGRFFCGYACAFGSLGDFVYALSGIIQKKIFKRKKQISITNKIDPWAQMVKFAVLLAIIVLCVLNLYSSFGSFSPWTVFASYVSLNPRVEGYVPGLIIMICIIVGMAFKERFFCQFLCPLGAIFVILPHLPFAHLKRDPEGCLKGCDACRRQCPVNIKLESDGFKNGECIGCDRCACGCPKGNLKRYDRRNTAWQIVSPCIKALILLALGIFAGYTRFF